MGFILIIKNVDFSSVKVILIMDYFKNDVYYNLIDIIRKTLKIKILTQRIEILMIKHRFKHLLVLIFILSFNFISTFL